MRGHVASVEKAWVDALRETRRGNLDLSYLELGRVLRSLMDAGVDVRYLRRYARQLGYLDLLVCATEAQANSLANTDPDAEALRAGFMAP